MSLPSPPSPSQAPPPTSDELDRVVTIWARVVQTQEHFNDICMRVRALYSTLIGALIAAYGFLLDKSKENLSVADIQIDALIPLSLSLSGFFVAGLFYFVDRYWYHALLLGAVDQGAEIEGRWKTALPDIKLGTKISARSPVDLSSKWLKYRLASLFVTDPRLRANRKLHSDAKIEIFYKPIMALMFLSAVASAFTGGIKVENMSVYQMLKAALET